MKNKLKILMLEDIVEDADLILWELTKAGIHFEGKRVDTQEQFIEALRNYQPDVVLSDHSLPGFNSTVALKICKRIRLNSPFILVTGAVSEEFAVTCLKQGADDYVLKSNLTRLPSAIKSALQQRELKAKQRFIELELRVQNEELVKINHELDNFVYSISHNLRGPLSTVLGLLNLTKIEDYNRSSWEQFVGLIGESVNKLDETLQEILDYSRNARNEIAREEVKFKDIVKSSLDKLQYLHGFYRIETKILIREDSPFFSDTYRIKVIINNILSNAIYYQDNHKERNILDIQITTKVEGASIVIEDNGEGIQPALKDKVFNMFFRGSAKSGGAGLGLYIVREMVSRLKGTISLESIYNSGTKVLIELPNLASGIKNVTMKRSTKKSD